MKTITISDLRAKGSAAIADDRPTYLIVNSKVKSVMISPEEYDMYLDAMEEIEDIRDYEARKNDERVSMDQVLKDLDISRDELQN